MMDLNVNVRWTSAAYVRYFLHASNITYQPWIGQRKNRQGNRLGQTPLHSSGFGVIEDATEKAPSCFGDARGLAPLRVS